MLEDNAEIKKRFTRLQELFSFITSHFGMYRSIYSKPNLIEELNDIDGPFFAAIQLKFRDSVVLELAKFLDSPETRVLGKCVENLSLRNLLRLYMADEKLPESEKLRYNKLITKAEAFSSDIQNIRNKYLAHNDLQYHLSQKIVEFPEYTKVMEIIEFCRVAMNTIEFNLKGSETGYPDTQASGFIYAISQSLRYEDLWKNKMINPLDHINLKKFD